MSPANVTLESLTSEIEQLQKLLLEEGVLQNEVNTRSAFIDPLLRALGWSDRSITREYTVNFSGSFYGEAKRKVDYALHEPGDRGALIAFIEAKRVSNNLSHEHRTQVRSYAAERDVQRFVLTNGDQWELYEKGKSSPITLSIRKLSASECARLLLEHFPMLPKPAIAQIVDPPKSLTSTMSESDALPSAPAISIHPTSELSTKLDFAKPIAWFAVCIIPFGIIGWITGVLTAQPTHTFFAYVGLVSVAAILFAVFLLVGKFFPSQFYSVLDTLLSMLRLSRPITRKPLTFVILAVICSAAIGGALGHFIGLWTAQRVADMLELLGLLTIALGIFSVLILLDRHRNKKKAGR